MHVHRPPLDAELAGLLADMPLTTDLTPELLAQFRQYKVPAKTYLGDRPIQRRELTIEAADGADLPVSVFRGPGAGTAQPCIYWIHGGGMVMGDRFANLDIPLDWLELHGAVVVTIDYRLAPEAAGTTLVDDCYQGLLWIAAHAADLGIDPARIVVAGASAGGGLAAATVLMARDLNGPRIAAQVLVCPMLDHRNDTVSSRQYSGDPGVWTREKNAFGWRAVLGDGPSEALVERVSPARAADLSGLPTTYIDVGSAEVFRDEDIDYAARICAAGGQAELHVWAGGFHGFDAMFPAARLSQAARQARNAWLGRLLTPAA
jgi:acetyl esterase/lipase